MDEKQAIDKIGDLAIQLATRCRSDFKHIGRNELMSAVHDDYAVKILDLCNATENT